VKRSLLSGRAGVVVVLAAVTAAAVIFLAACHARRLPEADSDAARTYVQRCGQCHRAYDPRAMTAAMWQTQVELMDTKIRQAGIEPLTVDQRHLILDYLTRNAGTR
jgi:Dihaem cytochrome c